MIIIEKINKLEEKPPVKEEKPNELNMTSKEWITAHGLRRKKLTLQTFLKESVFNHCDGVLKNSANVCILLT